jgi:hypothetical protein
LISPTHPNKLDDRNDDAKIGQEKSGKKAQLSLVRNQIMKAATQETTTSDYE